jgi:hypothetical protein
MTRRAMTTVLALLVLGSLARAQETGRLRWQPGQVLLYRAEHATLATDAMGDTRSETRTRLSLTKRWQVLEVDAAGVATLQMSLLTLSYETTLPNGEVMAFDSANPDKSSEQVRTQFTRYLGQPLVVVRIDSQGKVVEVKEAKFGFGSAAKFENELPFKIVLPTEGLRQGQTWDRNYQITLEPPQGTGEKVDAVQHCACKGVAGSLATVNVTTEIKNPPQAQADQVPLWQMQPEGEIVFDVQAGRMHKATLKIEKEAKGLQGEGSSTHFQSMYTEQYVGDR